MENPFLNLIKILMECFKLLLINPDLSVVVGRGICDHPTLGSFFTTNLNSIMCGRLFKQVLILFPSVRTEIVSWGISKFYLFKTIKVSASSAFENKWEKILRDIQKSRRKHDFPKNLQKCKTTIKHWTEN